MRGKCPAVIIVNIMQSNGAGVDKIDNSHRSVSSTVNWHKTGLFELLAPTASDSRHRHLAIQSA
jgi:hypothetical protein